MTTEMIPVSFQRTNFFTRWPCHVCGGCTEKDSVLCEGEQRLPDGSMRVVRVCPSCLKDAQAIDQTLERTAAVLEAEAAATRALIGRLKVPTFAAWEAAEKAADDEIVADMSGGEAA